MKCTGSTLSPLNSATTGWHLTSFNHYLAACSRWILTDSEYAYINLGCLDTGYGIDQQIEMNDRR